MPKNQRNYFFAFNNLFTLIRIPFNLTYIQIKFKKKITLKTNEVK